MISLLTLHIAFMAFIGCTQQDMAIDEAIEMSKEESGLILPNPLSVGLDSQFSPDYTNNLEYLAFSRNRYGNKDIWVTTLKGIQVSRTYHSADDFSPVFSPSGEKLAIVSRRADAAGDIHIIDLDHQEGDYSLRVVLEGKEDRHPSWDPNGERLIFSSRSALEATSKIMIFDLSSKKVEPFFSLEGDAPSFSTDGSLVTYSRRGKIFVFDIAREASFEITSGTLGVDGFSRFTSKNSQLVFSRFYRDTNEDGKIDTEDLASAWQIEFEGKSFKVKREWPLTGGEYGVFSPRLTGKGLLFTMQYEGKLSVASLPITGMVESSAKIDDLLHREGLKRNPQYSSLLYLQLLDRQRKDRKAYQKTLSRYLLHLALNRRFAQIRNVVDYAIDKDLVSNEYRKFSDLILLSEQIRRPVEGRHAASTLDKLDVLFSDLAKVIVDDPTFNSFVEILQARVLRHRGRYIESKQTLQKELEKLLILPTQDQQSKAEITRFLVAELLDASSRIFTSQDFLTYVSSLNEIISIDGPVRKKMIDSLVAGLSEYDDPQLRGRTIAASVKGDKVMYALALEAELELLNRLGYSGPEFGQLRSILETGPFWGKTSPRVFGLYLRRFVEIAIELEKTEEVEEFLFNLRDSSSKHMSEEIERSIVYYLEFLANHFLLKNHLEEAYEKAVIAKTLDPKSLSIRKISMDISFRNNELEQELGELMDFDNPSFAEVYAGIYGRSLLLPKLDGYGKKMQLVNDLIEEAEGLQEEVGHQVHLYMMLGFLYFQKGSLEKRIFKDNAGNQFTTFWTLTKNAFTTSRNYFDESISKYEQASALFDTANIEFHRIQQSLALVYLEIGNGNKALEYFARRSRTVEEAPFKTKKEAYWFWRKAAQTAFSLGEDSLAIEFSKKSIQSSLELKSQKYFSYAVDYLSMIYLKTSNYAGAIPLLKRQLLGAKSYNLLIVHLKLAFAYARLDRDKSALHHISKAKKVFDEDRLAIEEKLTNNKEVSYWLEIKLYLGPKYFGEDGFNARGLQVFSNAIEAWVYQKRGMWTTYARKLEKKLANLYALYEGSSLEQKKTLAIDIARKNLQLGRNYLSNGLTDSFYAQLDRSRPIFIEHFATKDDPPFEYFQILGQVLEGAMILGKHPDSEKYQGDLNAFLQGVGDAGKLSEEKKVLYSILAFSESQEHGLSNELYIRPFLAQESVATSPGSDGKNGKSDEVQEAIEAKKEGVLAENKQLGELVRSVASESDFVKSSNLMLATIDYSNFVTNELHEKNNPSLAPVVEHGTSVTDDAGLEARREILSGNQAWKLFLTLRMYEEARGAFLESIRENPGFLEYRDFGLLEKLYAKLFVKGLDEPSLYLEYLTVLGVIYNVEVLRAEYQKEQTARKADVLNLSEEIDSGEEPINSNFALTPEARQRLIDRLDKPRVANNLQWWALHYDGDQGDFLIMDAATSGVLYRAKTSETAIDLLISKLESEGSRNDKVIFFTPGIHFSEAPIAKLISRFKDRVRLTYLSPVNFLGSSLSLSKRRYVLNLVSQVSIGDILKESSNGDLSMPYSIDTLADADSIPWYGYNGFNSYVPINSPTSSCRFSAWTGVEENPRAISLDDFSFPGRFGFESVELVLSKSSPNRDRRQIGLFCLNQKFSSSGKTALSVTLSSGELAKFASIADYQAKKEVDFEEVVEILQDSIDEALDEDLVQHAIYYAVQLVAITEDIDLRDDYLGLLVGWLFQEGDFGTALFYQGLLASFKGEPYEKCSEISVAIKLAVKAGLLDYSKQEAMKCASIYKSEDDLEGLAGIYHSLAIAEEEGNNFEQAIEYYELAIDAFKSEGLLDEAEKRKLAIANIYLVRLNNYNEAISYLVSFIREDVIKSPHIRREAIISLANARLRMGQAQSSIELLEKEFELVNRSIKSFSSLRLAQNLSIALYAQGKVSRAQALNREILLFLEEQESSKKREVAYIEALNLKAMIDASQGDIKSALGLFEDVVQRSTRSGSKGLEALTYNNFGYWLREGEDVVSSLDFFEKALAIDIEAESPKDIAVDYRNLAYSQMLLGNYQLATQSFKEAEKISRKINVAGNLSFVLMGQAELYFRSNNWQLALKTVNEALDLAIGMPNHNLIWRALYLKSSIERMLGLQSEALDTALLAFNIGYLLEPGQSIRRSPSGLYIEVNFQQVTGHVLELLAAAGRSNDALAYSDLAKRRLKLDSFAPSRFVQSTLVSPQAKELIELRALLLSEIVASMKSKVATKEVLQELHSTTQQVNLSGSTDMLTLLDIPFFGSGKQNSETALSFFVSDRKTFVWKTEGSVITSKIVDFGMEQWLQEIDAYQGLLTTYSPLQATHKRLATILGMDLLSEKGGGKLYVSPYGPINYIALEALPISETSDLVDRFQVIQRDFLGQKTSFLDLQEPIYTFRGDSNIEENVADLDLFFFDREVKEIERLHLKSIQANVIGESPLLTAMSKANWLHFAGRGYFDADWPLDSYLNYGRDMRLGAEQILSASKTPAFVYLSSCDGGARSSGYGAFALSDAFFMRGSKFVVASPYRIPGLAAALISKHFYRAIESGDSPSIALARAKRRVKSFYPHPLFWASMRISESFL